MNASMKKLLSMLVVMAMVISMVPTFTLPAIAAETETASTTVTPGQANLPEGISTTNPVDNSDAAIDAHIDAGTCPMCNATGITWAKKTSTISNPTTNVHYYYEPNTDEGSNGVHSFTSNIIAQHTNANTTICVAIKSGTTLQTNRLRGVMMGSNGNTLNIMGTGTFHVDTVSATNDDYGIMQLGAGSGTARNTVNLYGCTFTHVTKQDATTDAQAIIRIGNAKVTVNMWDGAIIGPETVDATEWSHNVRVDAGIFNMYGGIIRNGVSNANGISGNVTIANSGKMYMYGGTIKGGTYYGTTANTGGNIVVGGHQQTKTGSSAGSFYMYGGTVEGGQANNGSNGGGNICCFNGSSVMELMGGTVKDGWAKAVGGNIQIMNGTTHKIGGTVLITNGEALYGGNIQIAASKKLTMEGGFVQGGTLAAVDGSTYNATNGGAVYVAGTFEMTGGEIDGCKVSGSGGNIYAAGGATVTIGANATIKNGLATTDTNSQGGGNVYLAASSTAGSTMTTEGTITGGTVNGGSADSMSSGGNICVAANGAIQSVLTVNGGTIADGTVTYSTKGSAYGGNIRAYNCKVVINDGLIYNGNAGSKSNGSVGVMGGTSTSADTNATLEINGGIIVGGVSGCTKETNTETTNDAGDTTYTHTCSITLTGSPKILRSYKVSDTVTSTAVGGYGLTVSNNAPLDISGLNSDAEIWVSGNTLDMVFTEAYDGTADLLSCFHHTADTTRAVGLTDDGKQLKVIEYVAPEPEVGVFDPESFGGMAYCDACLEQGKSEEDALVEWTAYSGANYSEATVLTDASNANAHYHLYLADDVTYEADKSFLVSRRTVCFNLNGHNITAAEGAKYTFGVTKTLNIFDSEGGAVVTGNQTSASTGATLHANGGDASATYNIYGGTFTKLESNTVSSIVLIGGNGGKINMYGGTIDATGKTATNGSAVYIQGTTDSDTTDTTNKNAVFTMYGGEIKGGTSTYSGGAIMVGKSGNTSKQCATFTLNGGTITGGTATTSGGIISVSNENTLNIVSGTITGGTAVNGGSIIVSSSTMTMSGGTISGGTAATNGGNIYLENATLTMSGGTISGGTADGTNNGNGGNIYASASTINMSNGTISGGKILVLDNNYGGGNIALNNTSVMNMSGGTVKEGVAGAEPATNKKTNAGNVLVNTGCTLNMSGDAKVIDGTAGNQGGNIRVWKGELHMSGNAEISGGTSYGGSPNVWLVCSDMTMTGNAVVYGNGTGTTGNAINAAAYGAKNSSGEITTPLVISTLTLSGNATVKNKEGTSNNSITLGWSLNNDAVEGDEGTSKLYITNDWTGEAYFYGLKDEGVAEGAPKSTLTVCAKGETLPEYLVVCGELNEGTFNKGGTFSGKLYYTGPVGTVGSDGDVIICVASVVSESGETWYMSNQEAVDAAAGRTDAYALINGNTTVVLNGDTYIDSRGYTVTVSGNGTLYALDRANDDYEGYGLWNVADTVTVAEEATNPNNGNRYITIESNGGYTAHRVEIQLSAVTLRAPAAGLYYKAQYKCDNTLAGRVMGYGVALSTDAMPGEDFLSVNEFTMYDGSEFNPEDHTVNTTSGSVFGILKEPGTDGRTATKNNEAVQTKIYANPYLAIDMDGTGNLDAAVYFLGDTKNGGKTAADADFDGIAFSLLEVLQKIDADDIWNSLTEEKKELVKENVEVWLDWLKGEDDEGNNVDYSGTLADNLTNIA